MSFDITSHGQLKTQKCGIKITRNIILATPVIIPKGQRKSRSCENYIILEAATLTIGI